jgi:hypothetical protein
MADLITSLSEDAVPDIVGLENVYGMGEGNPGMADLTDFESRLLATLIRLSDERGNPFTVSDEEVARASGFLLTSGVSRLLRSLEAKGGKARFGGHYTIGDAWVLTAPDHVP